MTTIRKSLLAAGFGIVLLAPAATALADDDPPRPNPACTNDQRAEQRAERDLVGSSMNPDRDWAAHQGPNVGPGGQRPDGRGRGHRQAGPGLFASATLEDQLADLPLATLTPAEEAGLAWMREEEFLAHDVYVTLGETWTVPVFVNIAAAEQAHADAVKVLLDRYGLPDPAADHVLGVFTDPEMQALHDSFVEQGRESLVAALTVGATIEDLDIADLQERATTTPDLALVYDHLEQGSRNHLRAFVRQLTNHEATYTPTHLSQDEYDEIISSEMEHAN